MQVIKLHAAEREMNNVRRARPKLSRLSRIFVTCSLMLYLHSKAQTFMSVSQEKYEAER